MKKLIFAGWILLVFVVPLKAQEDHDYNPNDKEPVAVFDLSKDQVPSAVVEAANNDFNLKNPETWTNFPYALKEYGWVYDSIGTLNVKPIRYEVKMKTNTGSDMYAVYSEKGNLIATREISDNVALPESVKDKLAKSKYSDWAVVGSQEIIRYYYDKKSVEQHIRVNVAKGGVKRSISFNFQANVDKNNMVQTRD